LHQHSQHIHELLKSHSLRVTSCREAVLDAFLNGDHAISQPELEKKFNQQFDRVTLYRTLSSFVDAGLLHRVPDAEGSARFALCTGCNSKTHTDEHVHFKCNTCGNTHCIDNLKVPSVTAPSGYIFTQTSYLVQGICPLCNT
jgi:Fur family ferric uptake transcriptional regulator